jgi:HK97 family phage major capsid protein
MEKVFAEDSLLSRCDRMTASGNTITFPTDETTPWQTTGGLQAYWEGENDLLSQSKLALKETSVRLNKLAALVPVTEELLEDANALDTYLRRKVPEKIDFAISKAIIQGTGVGQPLGILNAPCLVSVAKRTAGSPDQVADSLEFDNIVNMYSRMYAPCRANAVWLINQDVEPQLFKMSFNALATEPVPVYLPANGLSGQPYATLMGKPVIPTQACETLGDKGDIIFADLSKYLVAVKSGGIRADVSIHLYFDYDAVAYRFIMRIGGLPWWASYITPRDGTNYLSCFVTLDERA